MSSAEHAALTLRAAAEVFVPSAEDGTPGAADVHAELFVSHYLEFVMPGLAAGVPDLLDQLSAQHFDGRRFVDLSLGERGAVLDRVAEHELQPLRELPILLGLLAVAAVYGEWTGQDADGRLVREPLGWMLTGFSGPTRGRPGLLREP